MNGRDMDSPETSIRIENDGHRRTIRIEGPLDLPNAGPVRLAILEAIEASHRESRLAVLDLSSVVSVDLCGLQLLCSSHRMAVTCGVGLTLGEAPDWLAAVCTSVGFSRSRSTCPYRRGDNCLWSA